MRLVSAAGFRSSRDRVWSRSLAEVVGTGSAFFAVGRNPRAYRERRGLSQEDLAELVGVHRTYLGSVERGERNLTLKTVERIAESLNLDPRRLLAPPKRSKSPPSSR